MKHYLFTWYGITDLRAALGLELTDGPILSALKAHTFTDVVILAYTNPAKDQNGFTSELRANWEELKDKYLETLVTFPRDQTQQFVDAVSNTVTGHNLFMNWLETELATAGILCNIQIIPQELKHLNDAQGIYNAAASALKCALADPDKKTLTSFISPGTPVMAYTWALIARSHPQLNVRVISSSDPRQPPESIDLPKDLLVPLITGPQTVKPSEYDVIMHLLGRERMPIYFGMIQFQAATHIFITTEEFHHAATDLSRLLSPGCQHKVVIIRDPFRLADTQKALEKQVTKLPPASKIAANLTGGTKLMFAGALATCWARGIEPFYFEIKDHNIIFIRDGVTVPFIGARSVSEFFAVNGFDVVTQGRWEDNPSRAARMNVTKELWKARQSLGQLYQSSAFRQYRVPWGRTRNPPFDWKWKNSHASLNTKGEANLVLNGKAISVPNCDDYGQYLGGAWLEEYVFDLLRTLEGKGWIYDVRIGIEVGYAGRERMPNDPPIGEFDCSFTDGKRLWLVECKAGAVKQEHIQKLENNLKFYGGIAAKGVLVSSFPIGPVHAKRIRSLSAIYVLQARDVCADTLERIIAS